jgi:hypothetical protein
MMGMMYMGVCIFDFVVAPILWSVIQAVFNGNVQAQWQPLTIQGAGLFHLAMGAVLGIAAYGRTQEKLSGGLPSLTDNVSTTYIPPNQENVEINNRAPSSTVSSKVITGFGGRKAPTPTESEPL